MHSKQSSPIQKQRNSGGKPIAINPIDIGSVAFSSDGQQIISSSYDRTIQRWDRMGNPMGQAFQRPEGSFCLVVFSSDGQQIITANLDTLFRLDLTGNLIEEYPLQGQTGPGRVVALKIKFVQDLVRISRVSPVQESQEERDAAWNAAHFQAAENSIGLVDVSLDAQQFVLASHNILQLGDLQTGTFIGQSFQGHEAPIRAVAFSADGKRIVSGGDDRTVRLWDLAGNPIGQPFQGHQDSVTAVAFSPDGRTIVSSARGGSLRLWNFHKTQITFVSQKLQNDLPKGDDHLNIKKEIHAIADIVAMRELEPPLAVGVLGGWGSGKSFAMHLIQQRLNEIRRRQLTPEQAWEGKGNPYVGHIYQIRFDAWTYAKADLWSSLMQTIFHEFNRQLTLEKQIAEAIAKATKASRLSNNKGDVETLEQTNKRPLSRRGQEQVSQVMVNPEKLLMPHNKLFEGINYVRSLTVKSLRNLFPEKAVLEQPPLELDATDLQAAQLEGGEFWHVLNGMDESDRTLILQDKLPPEIFEEVKQSKSQKEFTDYLWKQIGKLRQVDKQELINKAEILRQEKKKLRFLIPKQAPIYFLRKNWMIVVAFLIGFGVAVYPLLDKNIKDRLPKSVTTALVSFPLLTSGSGLFSVMLTIKSLLNKTREEQEKILTIWKESQDALQSKIQSTTEFGLARYHELLHSDPKIKRKLEDIQNLENQIDVQQQQLGLASAYPTLNAFVSDRLQTDSYGKQLGSLQQVQRDLADLTSHFTWSSQVDVSQEHFKEKIEKLQTIFPRGPARIVLYIDDLDRCPPDQVVKVLEAVQLILKTPLFIVVLAIDDRYIARALEKAYEGVLTRQGHPSGIDYLEKIIQLPYRMRPISPEGLESYLKSQIDLEEVGDRPSVSIQTQMDESSQALVQPNPAPIEQSELPANTENSAQSLLFDIQSTPPIEPKSIPPLEEQPPILIEDIPQITKFTLGEFKIINDCCRYVDISPRTAKRLINVFKILKIVWSTSSEPNERIKTVIISFLALSGRYPDFMRYAFIEIDSHFEKASLEQSDRSMVDILQQLEEPFPSGDKYASREWKRFQYDVQMMIPNDLTLGHVGRPTFNLILSFSFVGDIGYDPNDLKAESRGTKSEEGTAKR